MEAVKGGKKIGHHQKAKKGKLAQKAGMMKLAAVGVAYAMRAAHEAKMVSRCLGLARTSYSYHEMALPCLSSVG